jgi:BirA family biotin operon repressor/biotin-[acetyl-CoA-carboxylase] ligase
MRWPNDVLVQDRKLAGLLIDQFVPGLAVVGVGLNVTNEPERREPGLSGSVARLAELIPVLPTLSDLCLRLLRSLAAIYAEWGGPNPVLLYERINALWQTPRPVHLELDEGGIFGQFIGVDERGRLQLRTADGGIHFYEPQRVRLLRDSP